MAAYRIKIKGKTHVIDRLTLGQLRTLREHFDVRDVNAMNPADPAVIAGFAYLCIARENPEWEHKRLMNFVDELTTDDFEAADDDPLAVAPGA